MTLPLSMLVGVKQNQNTLHPLALAVIISVFLDNLSLIVWFKAKLNYEKNVSNAGVDSLFSLMCTDLSMEPLWI